MNVPSVREVPKAVISLAVLGLLVLVASSVLSKSAAKAKSAIS